MGRAMREFVAEELWLLIGILTFAGTGLAAISGFGMLVPAIAVIGWFLLVPIFLFWGEEIAAAVFDGREDATRETNREHDAVSELKRRYAEGEIDDAEFQRRLERLLEVDGALDDAFADAGRGDPTLPSDRFPEHHGTITDVKGADDGERDPALERE